MRRRENSMRWIRNEEMNILTFFLDIYAKIFVTLCYKFHIL